MSGDASAHPGTGAPAPGPLRAATAPVAPAPVATVVITTRNRKDVAATAIRSALAQDVPVEVIVIDDGSTDGTADLVRSEFPTVRLKANPESRGYIVGRNEAARLATTPYLFSLDDDAVFSTPAVVRQSLTFFDRPWVGAVMVPHFDIIDGERSRPFQWPPDADGVYVVPTYIGCSHVVRRDLFLQLGGYPEDYLHWGEEAAFCRKMMNAGRLVRLVSCDPVHHHPFQGGRHGPRNAYALRNGLLSAFRDTPLLQLPREFSYALAKSALTWFRSDGTMRPIVARGIWLGLKDGPLRPRRRDAISGRAFKLFRYLRAAKVAEFGELTRRFPWLARSGDPRPAP